MGSLKLNDGGRIIKVDEVIEISGFQRKSLGSRFKAALQDRQREPGEPSVTALASAICFPS